MLVMPANPSVNLCGYHCLFLVRAGLFCLRFTQFRFSLTRRGTQLKDDFCVPWRERGCSNAFALSSQARLAGMEAGCVARPTAEDGLGWPCPGVSAVLVLRRSR